MFRRKYSNPIYSSHSWQRWFRRRCCRFSEISLEDRARYALHPGRETVCKPLLDWHGCQVLEGAMKRLSSFISMSLMEKVFAHQSKQSTASRPFKRSAPLEPTLDQRGSKINFTRLNEVWIKCFQNGFLEMGCTWCNLSDITVHCATSSSPLLTLPSPQQDISSQCLPSRSLINAKKMSSTNPVS